MKSIDLKSLSRKAIKSSFWVFGLNFSERGLQTIRTIVLARLLSPHDFGLFGIAGLVMSLLNRFSQTGFEEALIQRKECTKEYLDTAWTVGILRSAFLFLILFFGAPWASRFFNVPQATLIIRIFSLSLLVDSLRNIGYIFFAKELDFHKYFLFRMSGVSADFMVAVITGLIMKNVWALVYGGLTGSLVRTLISYKMIPYVPKFKLELSKAQSLFSYGKWLLGGSILQYLLTEGDKFFVGKMLGATPLGFYQMGFRMGTLPSTQFAQLVSQVAFPVYAKLQESKEKIRRALKEILELTLFISFPFAGGLLILAPEFVRLILGEKWIPMTGAFQILCLLGFIRPLVNVLNSLMRGIGRPDIMTKLSVVHLIVFFTTLYPLTKLWGIKGTSLSVVISLFVTKTLPFIFASFKIISTSKKEIIKPILFPFFATLTMMWVVYSSKQFFKELTVLNFLFWIFMGILSYVMINLLLQQLFKYEAMSKMARFIKTLR